MYPTIPRTWPALLLLLPLLLVLGLSAAHSTCAQQVDKARTYTTQFDHDPSKFVHFIGTEVVCCECVPAHRLWLLI